MNDLLLQAQRWPRFATLAEQLGIVAIAAFPLRTEHGNDGVLAMCHDRPRSWTPEEVEIGRLLTRLLSASVVAARRVESLRDASEHLQSALDSRVVIEQAKGILAGALMPRNRPRRE